MLQTEASKASLKSNFVIAVFKATPFGVAFLSLCAMGAL